MTEMIKIDGVPEIVNDTGWKGTEFIRYRGIVDYERFIEFKEELSLDQTKLVEKYLQSNKCPGWTGVETFSGHFKKEYKFKTTMDSSG